jgi:hypothetical protein
MNKRSLLAASAALTLTMAALPADAQVSLVPRALGMGGAAVGVARGQEALFVNPANLGLPDEPNWSIGLLQFGAGTTLSGLSVGDVPDLLQYQNLSDAERDRLFNSIPPSGFDADMDIRAPLVGIQSGPVALGLAYTSVGQHSLSHDLVELLLYGYEEGRTDYDVTGTAGSRMTYWDAALAYGTRVGALSVGVTGHYLRGGSLVRSRVRQPQFDLAARDIEVGYTGVMVHGGTGYAADFGAAYQPTPALTIGASVSNAFARLDWSDDLRLRDLTLDRQAIEAGDVLDLLERYGNSERAASPDDDALLDGITAESLQEDASPPTTVRAGLAWNAAPGTQLVGSYQSSSSRGGFSGAWDRMLGAGIQQKLPLLLTARAGFATAFDEGSMWTAGASLGPLDLGVAHLTASRSGASRAGWIGTFGLSVRTQTVRGR